MTQLLKTVRRTSSADGGVVLDLRRGTMFRVNPLGSRILDLLESGEPFSGIAGRISVEFGVALEVVQADLKEFLDCLELHGVLDRGSRSA